MKKNQDIGEIKNKISSYRKRLENIKKQGYHFSQDIYNDINLLEKKIFQPTFNYQIKFYKKQLFTGILFIFSIIVIWNIIIPPGPEPMSILFDEEYNNRVISENINISGTAINPNGNIESVYVNININQNWEKAIGTTEWKYTFDITNLSNGKYILSFKCSDGKIYSDTKNIIIIVNKTEQEFNLKINNLENGTNIRKNYPVEGTASCTTGIIKLVQAKIDNISNWKEIDGTTEWKYILDVTNLSNGKYTILFRCSDGNEFSNSTSRTIIVKKSLISIDDLLDGTTIKHIYNITGTVSSEQTGIQKIEICFNNGKWYDANGISPWYYEWDTTNLNRNKWKISVRGRLYNNTPTESIQINVSINNEDIKRNNLFGIFLPPDNNKNLTPNKKYKLYGFHSKGEKNILGYEIGQITTLDVSGAPEWLIITFESKTINTPPDEKVHHFIYYFEISDDAIMNQPEMFTIKITTKPDYSKIPIPIVRYILQILSPAMEIPQDIWIETGEW